MTRAGAALLVLLCVLMAVGLRAAFQSFDHALDHFADRQRMSAATTGDDELALYHELHTGPEGAQGVA